MTKQKSFNTMYPGYCQKAYVTTDIDHAMTLMNRAYRIKEWAVSREFSYAPLPGKSLTANLAMTNVGDTQFEIIQPISGDDDFYRNMLEGEGFQLKFHHHCILFDTQEQYQEHFAYLTSLGVYLPMVMTLDREPGLGLACYADFRDTLGHYLEYIWYTEAGMEWMETIPRI